MKKRYHPEWYEKNEEEERTPNSALVLPQNIMLAHAYVAWQFYDQAFSPQEALMKGTLFPELYGAYPIPR